MPPLSPISHRDLIRRLREFGFEGPYTGGRHAFMIKGGRRLTLPNPYRGDIGVERLARLLRQAAISPEEWAAHER